MKPTYSMGLDIGSTTIKAVVLDGLGNPVFTHYERHNAHIREKLLALLDAVAAQTGTSDVALRLTGSVGMGVAETCGLDFVQEVVAATHYVRANCSRTATMIDIGGEDAKVVLFSGGRVADMRMNGNCAGGTGAFIDQMAILLGVTTAGLNDLALRARHVYPIASRCGVFSKTDIQNLLAKNASREDIAASVFHAVAVQVSVTLAHGCEIGAPVLFCGGPLTFLPALRRAFEDYLSLTETDVVLPADSHLAPAWGAALTPGDAVAKPLACLAAAVRKRLSAAYKPRRGLEPIFRDAEDLRQWRARLNQASDGLAALHSGPQEATLGIDSGSTTTKIVLLDQAGRLLCSDYHANDGNPVAAVERGLARIGTACRKTGAEVRITGSCVTGYGEDLVKAAFGLDAGIVETIAHYMAARRLTPDVSFILDIGGQDMKAMFVQDGVVSRVEINEACSSGCGSFIGTFARSLGYGLEDFAAEACRAAAPCDLGTRCTVFMNSKVKQALREGATVADIAAGLSYSVVKNCLYKVLRLKHTEELGEHVVVQGGTMKNDSVVRAFEKLTGREVFRSAYPELMGAVGCALYALEHGSRSVSLADLAERAACTTQERHCRGCENQCRVTAYDFGNGCRYYSGNRCEKVFSNRGKDERPGLNVYADKARMLFDREQTVPDPVAVIGIPRCLNMYEEYPFWHTLFTRCGLRVALSSPSTFTRYEEQVKRVMSDNICFPAKLAHSHIQDLADRGVDRIFMPFVVYAHPDGGQNSYNCPIVSGYSEVVRSVQGSVPVDSPAITFKDRRLLYRQCRAYLLSLGVDVAAVRPAFRAAVEEMDRYAAAMAARCRDVLREGRRHGALTVLLAGRPYHADPLVQHKLADTIAAMGVNVITDDIVRGEDIDVRDAHFVAQWAYANRILRAVKWAAREPADVQCMQLTSFGCGPDAFLTDETRALLKRYGKSLTLLKIDDVCNLGSAKLRVRSAIESLRLAAACGARRPAPQPFATTRPFRKEDRGRKILAPFFTPFISPLIPSLMRVAGYDVDNLPVSDAASSEWGLRYANNEVCYPATLIVGDVVKAFKEGRYDPRRTAVAMTQTGGQCRASNYVALIRRALSEAGYGDVPVVALTFGGGLRNEQPGFRMNWTKLLPIVLNTLLYTDCVAKLYYATAARERKPGEAARLRDLYLGAARRIVESNAPDELLALLALAVKDFNAALRSDAVKAPRVGIVGEIFLKFHPFAQRGISQWLVEHGIEVAPPLLTEFFVQGFVNFEVKQQSGLRRRLVPDGLVRWLYGRVWRRVERFNRVCGGFRYFVPFGNVYAEAAEAAQVVSLNAQFGEGWMLPAEILSLARQGVSHVISLQPFGCIANHIVVKGIEKRIRQLWPDLHLLSLDFDSGVSDVNVMNRLLLFVDGLSADGRPASAAIQTGCGSAPAVKERQKRDAPAGVIKM